MEVFFFRSVKKIQLSGTPIRVLKNQKFLYHILSNTMESLWTNFEVFSMTHLRARYNLVDFFEKKNLTSNGSKPIRVLTRTKSSCSDVRLPLSYPLPDFQQI